MNKIVYGILIMILVCPYFLQAQQPACGSDQLRSIIKSSNPNLEAVERFAGDKIFHGITSRFHSNTSSSLVTIIPVVFHLMHNNGPENVPDSVVIAAVNELNLRYQNSVPFYDSTGHAVNIEFCLATIDPAGNPTTGITRTVTPLTLFTFPTDDQLLKNQVRWSPDLYYNVWVVNNISGFIDGYSSFPYNAGTSIDGVVIEYSYIVNSFLLAHETGHYCGLYHTWQGGCTNYNCFLDGDQVCDTPPDNSSSSFSCMGNSCTTDLQDTTGLNPLTADVNELPNYMDYTTCPLSFSEGQAMRMETAVPGLRTHLYLSNGCGIGPLGIPPVAGFTAIPAPCNNGQVMISDSLTINGITSEWDFNNDGQYDTLAHQFTWTAPATGTYTIRQRSTGVGGQDTTSIVVNVLKGSTFNYPIITYPQAVTDTVLACEGQQYTFEGDSTGVSWLWSTGETTSSITVTADSSMDISLTMTDSSGLTWSTQCTPIHLQVFEFNTPNITYDDTVGYLCQGDPVELYITNYIPGIYYWWIYHITTGNVNTGSHDTSQTFIPDPTYGNMFYVTFTNPAGCTSQSNTIYLQPQYLPFLSGIPLMVNGNTLSVAGPVANYQWTNFGTPIPGATGTSYNVTSTGCYGVESWFTGFPLCKSETDTVCFAFTGLEESDESGFTVYPNPANEKLQVILNPNSFPEAITIFNSVGQKIHEQLFDKSAVPPEKIIFETTALTDGIYFVRVQADNGIFIKMFVKAGD